MYENLDNFNYFCMLLSILFEYCLENMQQENLGEPILDKVLEAGDTLYFPRGVIHQGFTLKDSHSLHITISLYQKSSWGDYLEKVKLFVS